MNQIVTVKVGTRSAGLRNEGGSVLRSTREKHRGPCGAVVCHQICSALCGRRGGKKMTTPAPAQQFQAKGLLFSEDACNRHKMGRDAKQLAGKLTASTVTVWKYFNKLETISKMVDSSDSVRRQRAALCRLSVYFSSLIKFTAKRQATGDRPPSSPRYFCSPLPSVSSSPSAH